MTVGVLVSPGGPGGRVFARGPPIPIPLERATTGVESDEVEDNKNETGVVMVSGTSDGMAVV